MSPLPFQTHPDPRPREAIVLTISDEVAKVHAQTFGRAPAEARAIWHEEFVVVVLEQIFSARERTLVDAGRFDRVRGDRQSLHNALEPTLRTLVETLTGQLVRAQMSEISPEDVGFEAFVLGPRTT